MPSWIELQHFLAHGSRERAPARRCRRSSTCTAPTTRAARLARARRARLRPPLTVRRARDRRRRDGASARARERIAALQAAGRRAAARAGAAARGAGCRRDRRRSLRRDVLPQLTGSAGWVARPVEQPGSRPLAFEGGENVRWRCARWPAEHVAKCLVALPSGRRRRAAAAQIGRLRRAAGGVRRDRARAAARGVPAARAGGRRRRRCARALAADLRGRRASRLVEAAAAGRAKTPGDASPLRSLRHDPHCRGVLVLGLEAQRGQLARSSRWRRGTRSAAGSRSAARSSRDAARGLVCRQPSDDEVVADKRRALRARWSTLWRRARESRATTRCDRPVYSAH